MAKKKTNTAGIARREANAARNKQNNKKKTPVKLTRQQKMEKEAQSAKRLKIFISIFASVALVAVILTVLFAAIIPAIQAKRQRERESEMLSFDSNMNDYINLGADAYTNIDVTMLDKAPNDDDVENEVLSLLYNNAATSAIDTSKGYIDRPIGAGDIANIFYRGYITGTDGKRDYFTGGSNFGSDITALSIGAGKFIPGFELALVGKVPENYVSVKDLSNIPGTVVGEDSIIFITYGNIPFGSTATQNVTRVVDMSEDVDAQFAEGFRDYLLGAVCGEKIKTVTTNSEGKEQFSFAFTYETEDGKTSTFTDVTVKKIYARTSVSDVAKSDSIVEISYQIKGENDKLYTLTETIDLSNAKTDETWGEGFTASIVDKNVGDLIAATVTVGEEERSNVTVKKVYARASAEDEVLTIDVTFAANYGNETLNGKDAKFDIYIIDTNDCADIVFDDKFITDTLKVKAEDLSEYEGEALTDKYRAKILAELNESYQDSLFETVTAAVLDALLKKAEVKKLPEGEVLANYNAAYSTIEYYYNYYVSQGNTTYNTIDKVAIAYLGLSSGADWKAELRKQAEEAVTRQIAFYYAVKALNYLPNEAEAKALRDEIYNETYESFMSTNLKSEDDYDSKADYEAAKKTAESNFKKQYTDEYFVEQVRYEFAMKKFMENNCNIHYGPVEK